MTSLQTRIKQIPANDGYYITVATGARDRFYANIGTDSAPSLTIGPIISSMSSAGAGLSTIVNAAGAIFRDMGKTLTSSGRVFRKVQLLVSSATTEGVGGNAATVAIPVDYLTGFIELPGTGGMSSGSGSYTPVARLG